MSDNVDKHSLVKHFKDATYFVIIFAFNLYLSGLFYLDAFNDYFGFSARELDLRNIDLLYASALVPMTAGIVVLSVFLFILRYLFEKEILDWVTDYRNKPIDSLGRGGPNKHVVAILGSGLLLKMFLFISVLFVGWICWMPYVTKIGRESAEKLANMPPRMALVYKTFDPTDKEVFVKLRGNKIASTSQGMWFYTKIINNSELETPVTVFIPSGQISAMFLQTNIAPKISKAKPSHS